MMSVGVDLDLLTRAVTGRGESIFGPAMQQIQGRLEEQYSGSSVLVTGGAGFIAGQTLRQLLPMRPAKMVVADTSENSLAELVRDLRSSGSVPAGVALEPRLVDVTGPMIDRLCADEGPFDVVLAFAAAKHVRTERDPVSALHMVNVNVNGTLRSVRAAKAQNPEAAVFVVSTDKAADPASLMGASKRLMEMVVLGSYPDATTTRFANVAFSSGSLLESWLLRLSRRQVLPVPADTRRFFVSPKESGQLCAIASAAPPGGVVVPESGLVGSVELLDALLRVLDSLDVRASVIEQGPVREGAGDLDVTTESWPVLLTPRDTAGEKGAEVFVGDDESSDAWLPGLRLVHTESNVEEAVDVAGWIARQLEDPIGGASLHDIETALARAIPNLHHVSGTSRLDDRV
jgi:nucleoside-diphosphate-sugar epimerase